MIRRELSTVEDTVTFLNYLFVINKLLPMKGLGALGVFKVAQWFGY